MGGGIGSILYSDHSLAAGPVESFTYNAVGHTVALTDNLGGVTKTDRYEAFGNIVSSTGSSDNNRLANTKERDFSLGLDNHGYRYYDPSIGRYLTRDPLGYADGLNPYLYVHNNPINHIDPLGLITTRDVWDWSKRKASAAASTALSAGRVTTQFAVGVAEVAVHPAIGRIAPVPRTATEASARNTGRDLTDAVAAVESVVGKGGMMGGGGLMAAGGAVIVAGVVTGPGEVAIAPAGATLVVTGAGVTVTGGVMAGHGAWAQDNYNSLTPVAVQATAQGGGTSGGGPQNSTGAAQNGSTQGGAKPPGGGGGTAPTARRVSLRKDVKQQIEANASRDEWGRPIDPNTGQPIETKRDVGHKTGEEWRTRSQMHQEQGSTRKKVIEAENDPDLYRLEDPSSNRSHRYEEK